MVNETGFQLKVITVIVYLKTAVTQKYSSKRILGYYFEGLFAVRVS